MSWSAPALSLRQRLLTTFRASPRSLRGLRLIRSQLKEQPLTQEDLTMLGLLRLDMIGTVAVTPNGEPGLLSLAHLNPPSPQGPLYTLLKPTSGASMPGEFRDIHSRTGVRPPTSERISHDGSGADRHPRERLTQE